MKFTGIVAITFFAIGIITTAMLASYRTGLTVGSELLFMIAPLWLAIVCIVVSSLPLQRWLDLKRKGIKEDDSRAKIKAVIGIAIAFSMLIFTAISYNMTAPSYARVNSLLEKNKNDIALRIWCKKYTGYSSSYSRLERCVNSYLDKKKIISKLEKTGAKETFVKLLDVKLKQIMKKSKPRRYMDRTVFKLMAVARGKNPDSPLYTQYKMARVDHCRKKLTCIDSLIKVFKTHDTTDTPHYQKALLIQKEALKIQKDNMVKQASGHVQYVGKSKDLSTMLYRASSVDTKITHNRSTINSSPEFKGIFAATRILKKTLTEMPAVLGQNDEFGKQIMRKLGYKTFSIHKHLIVVMDKENRPIMVLREREKKFVGAMTLLPLKKGFEKWSPESLDKFLVPLLRALPEESDTAKPKKLKAYVNRTQGGQPVEIFYDGVSQTAITRAIIGKIPVEFQHLSMSWLANHMAAFEHYDGHLKTMLTKKGLKGATLTTYHRQNKAKFHTSYYDRTHKSSGVFIYPLIVPTPKPTYRSSYRSSGTGYRSTSSSRSGYRSSGRSYRTGSTSRSSYRSSSRSGYRSGKN